MTLKERMAANKAKAAEEKAKAMMDVEVEVDDNPFIEEKEEYVIPIAPEIETEEVEEAAEAEDMEDNPVEEAVEAEDMEDNPVEEADEEADDAEELTDGLADDADGESKEDAKSNAETSENTSDEDTDTSSEKKPEEPAHVDVEQASLVAIDKLKNEQIYYMNSVNESYKALMQPCANYIFGELLRRVIEDETFAVVVAQEHKTYERCMKYIYDCVMEMRNPTDQEKRDARNGVPICCALDNLTIIEWAVAYYLYDDKEVAEFEIAKREKERKEAAERAKKAAEKKATESGKKKLDDAKKAAERKAKTDKIKKDAKKSVAKKKEDKKTSEEEKKKKLEALGQVSFDFF